MKPASPKLPLTTEEKMNLRTFKVKINGIASMDLSQLASCLQSSNERAQFLRGLAQFQSIPSIGLKVAERVVEMGYYSLGDIKTRMVPI